MNQWASQILVVSAIVLPPIAVFLMHEVVNSGLFLTFPLPQSTPSREIHVRLTLSGFSRLHTFPGVKLIGLALGINVATLFYGWIDKEMNLVLKPPGFIGAYVSTHVGIPPFVFLFFLIVVEIILICWMAPKCKKTYEVELRNTVDRLSRRAPQAISQLKKGKIRAFDEWIERYLKETKDYLRHQERSMTARIGFLIVVLALVMIFF